MEEGQQRPDETRLIASQESPLMDSMAVYQHAIEEKITVALRPTFIRVENTSCRYLQRKLLGSKRYWYRSIKHDKTAIVASKKWIVNLYEVPWRKSIVDKLQSSDRVCTNGDLFPQLKSTLIGTFESEKAAISAYDAAVKLRDQSNPISLMNDLMEPLPSFWNRFLQVTVISEAFSRKSHDERMYMVLEIILSRESGGPENQSFHCTQLHKHGTIGAHVRQLPHLRYLECDLVLVLKTPAQFKALSVESLPLTERFGLSHIFERTLGMNAKAKTTSKDIKRLMSDDPPRTKLPHFYHGLPLELKNMMANEQSIQRGSYQGSALMSQLQKNSESDVMKKYEKRRRECARAAIMLQRVFRVYFMSRVLRKFLGRHRHALTIQRCYRGYVVRVFTREFFMIVSFASTHIQSVYRSYTSRQRTKALRTKVNRAAIEIQRVFRGNKARKFVFWIRYNVASAIQIQRCIRGMFGRERARMHRKAKMKKTVIIPAAALIQRVYRGFKGRQRYNYIKQFHYIERIQTPAAKVIQRIVRGHLGRLLAFQLKKELLAALVIQEKFRKYQTRCRWAFVWKLRFQHRMASRIGAAARGYLARQVYKRELRKRRIRRVYIPACRTIQRVYRGHVVRKNLEELRDRIEAATVLQYFWRKKRHEEEERRKWNALLEGVKLKGALTIQCAIRCLLARKRVLEKRYEQRGNYGQAAIKVQSAWRSYCNRTKIKQMREFMRIEILARKLTELKDDMEMIQFDKIDAQAEIKALTKHKKNSLQQIHDLKQMRLDWELRVPVLDKELAEMTLQDKDRGWQEAFETEKIVIHFSRLLSAEEILSKKQQAFCQLIRELEADISALQMEDEDLDRDVEEFLLKETMLLEEIRRLEMSRASLHFNNSTNEAIRRQRIRWKIRSNRVNIIRRERNAELKELAKTLGTPPTTVSYSAAQEQLRNTNEKVNQHLSEMKASAAIETEHHGSRNPQLLAVANNIVAECHKIIRTGSLAMNLDRTDIRDDPSQMCWECGHIQCVCHIQKPPSAAPKGISTASPTKKTKPIRGIRLGRRRRHDRHTDGVDE